MAYPAIYKRAKAKKKVTKKRVVKKRRTPAQIAATKKLVALNKRHKTVKKTVAKPAKKSVRRKTNPRKVTRKWRVLCVVPSVAGLKNGLKDDQIGYWTGTGWDTRKHNAVRYPTVEAARNEASHLPKKYRSGTYWSYATETV